MHLFFWCSHCLYTSHLVYHGLSRSHLYRETHYYDIFSWPLDETTEHPAHGPAPLNESRPLPPPAVEFTRSFVVYVYYYLYVYVCIVCLVLVVCTHPFRFPFWRTVVSSSKGQKSSLSKATPLGVHGSLATQNIHLLDTPNWCAQLGITVLLYFIIVLL